MQTVHLRRSGAFEKNHSDHGGASAHVAPVIREVDSVKEHALRNLRTRNVKRLELLDLSFPDHALLTGEPVVLDVG